jgi:hypothetical protein
MAVLGLVTISCATSRGGGTSQANGNPCQGPGDPPNAHIRPGRRISEVGIDPKVTPALPPELQDTQNTVWGLFNVCVSPRGSVDSVQILKSTGLPHVDTDWANTMTKWRYAPYCVDNQPKPFCTPARMQVNGLKP